MTTFALNNLWTYLQGLSLSQNDREWLANKLIMPTGDAVSSDSRLDAALSRFHKDWGGDKDVMEIAKELRQGVEMQRDVDTW